MRMESIAVNHTNKLSPVVSPAAPSATNGNAVNRPEVSQNENVQDGRELENLVAVSEDGDTLQVSDQGNEDLENARKGLLPEDDKEDSFGKVTMRDDQQSDERETQKITSYAGYTDSQVEQLYLKGDISKTEYDQEMEKREKQREDMDSLDSHFRNRMAYHMNEINMVEQDEEAIDTALSENAADQPLRADERLKVMEALDRTIQNTQMGKQETADQQQQASQITVQVNNQTVQAGQMQQTEQNQVISEDGMVRLRIS